MGRALRPVISRDGPSRAFRRAVGARLAGLGRSFATWAYGGSYASYVEFLATPHHRQMPWGRARGGCAKSS